MSNIDIKLKGFAELEDKLRKFPILLQEDVLNKAMVAGAQIYRDYARAKAPVGWRPHRNKKGAMEQPGTGKASIMVRKLKQSNDATVNYGIGIFKKGWYMKLIESGWTPTGPRKKGVTFAKMRKEAAKTRGKVEGRPFLLPAYNTVTNTVLETVRRTIQLWVGKYANPVNK